MEKLQTSLMEQKHGLAPRLPPRGRLADGCSLGFCTYAPHRESQSTHPFCTRNRANLSPEKAGKGLLGKRSREGVRAEGSSASPSGQRGMNMRGKYRPTQPSLQG